MAATLERTGKDEKPIPSNLPAREIIPCSDSECEFSYTLSYTQEESFLSGTELNIARMRRLAVALIEREHPTHLTKSFLWKGPERGWLEADLIAARRAQ